MGFFGRGACPEYSEGLPQNDVTVNLTTDAYNEYFI